MKPRLLPFLPMLAAALFSAAALQPVRAEDERFGSSFITPFPSGDIYKLQVIGDDMADGLLAGLGEAFLGDVRLDIQKKTLGFNGLMRPDFDDKLAAAEEAIKAAPPHIVIAMMGAWDRVSTRDANGKRIPVGTPQWRVEYGARADRLMKMLKRYNASVYWVGLPNVRKPDANDDAQMMNEVLRERLYVNSMKYIDAYAGFADEDGGFSPFGPDITGKILRLRDGDGVYFTVAGNRKLAHFVERDLRRDLNQAKSDRAIPLAGSEADQSKINPDKAKIAAEPSEPGWNAKAAAEKSAQAVPAGGGAGDGAAGDQKADNGKVSLKITNPAGREESVAVEVLRPAIPASVVALVTRRESADRASQMGETLVDQIPGGFTVMSTFTPSASATPGGGRKLSPSQTPYFRVLLKGERLAPKRGRADDASWPRFEQTSAVAKPGAAAAAEAAKDAEPRGEMDGTAPPEAAKTP